MVYSLLVMLIVIGLAGVQQSYVDEQAQKFADNGKQNQVNKLHATVESLRDEASVFEDLNEILVTAINYVQSDDSHNYHDD